MQQLDELAQTVYSGRGIVVAMNTRGESFIGYSLTGRSPSSQARRLVKTGFFNRLAIKTDVTDATQLAKGNPALLLYTAIASVKGYLVASNGVQTSLVVDYINNVSGRHTPADNIINAMKDPAFMSDGKGGFIDITTYEPDAPNYTPRITACLHKDNAAIQIVKRSEAGNEKGIWQFLLKPGEGYLITTYKGGNENPLLPYDGEPKKISTPWESVDEIAETLYASIRGVSNPVNNFRVATAVVLRSRMGYLKKRIINRTQT